MSTPEQQVTYEPVTYAQTIMWPRKSTTMHAAENPMMSLCGIRSGFLEMAFHDSNVLVTCQACLASITPTETPDTAGTGAPAGPPPGDDEHPPAAKSNAVVANEVTGTTDPEPGDESADTSNTD